MCRVEDSEPWKIFHSETPTARQPWVCCECGRVIPAKEKYHLIEGLFDDRWWRYRMCQHCNEAARWLTEMCDGYCFTEVLDELVEHWHEGYRSIPFARLIAGMKRKWHGGADPLPVGAGELAKSMMVAAVR